jgi:hypothetical protein
MCLCSLSVSVSPEGEDIVIADVSHRGRLKLSVNGCCSSAEGAWGAWKTGPTGTCHFPHPEWCLDGASTLDPRGLSTGTRGMRS